MSEIHIVGAGLAGMTLALALGKAGFQVTVLEAAAEQKLRDFEQDKRTTALAYTTKVLLDNLGLWSEVADASSPIQSMLVSTASAVSLRFDPSTFTDNPMGYICANKALRKALLGNIEVNTNIRILCDAKIKSFTKDAGRINLNVEIDKSVSEQKTDLLIGCDGRQSAVRKLAGFSSFDRDYHQSAVVATLGLARPHHNQAFQIFTKTGPIALLPLPDSKTHVSLIWSHDTEAAVELKSLDDESFLALLNQHIQTPFSAAIQVEDKQVFPLHAHYLSNFVDDRIALLGEAAHGVHPLAGQGFNLTARDIGTMVEVLSSGHNNGERLGAKHVLETYERRRVGDSARMFGVTDFLTQSLSGNLRLPAPLRDLGFAAVDQSDSLRERLTKHAMGMVDDLPALMKENWPKKFATA